MTHKTHLPNHKYREREGESILCKSESGNLHQTINSQTKLEAIDSECAGILTNNNKSIET